MENKSQSDAFSRLRKKFNHECVKHPFRVGIPLLTVTGSALAAVVILTSCTVCCTVSSNGQKVAYCPDSATLDEAIVQAETRAAAILHRPYSFDEDTVSIHLTVAPKDSVEAVSDVTDSLLEAIPEIQNVYTLTVDGIYIGANQDPAVLEKALREVQLRYETRETISSHVDSTVSIQQEYVPAENGTLTQQQLIDALLAETPRQFSYIAQSGDDPVTVAENFGMTLARLQELNPQLDLSVYVEAESILTAAQPEETEEAVQREANPYAALADVAKPGTGEKDDPFAALAEVGTEQQEEAAASAQTVSVRDFLTATENPVEAGQMLTIEQSCPLLEVTTIEETAFIRTIQPERQVQTDEALYAGQERIVQEGSAGYADVVARQVRRCGVLTASVDLSAETTTEPVPVIVATGSQPIPNMDNGLFLWPVRGHISSDFGYRYIFGSTNFHRGVDIAAAMGTPICAADNGTVVFTGPRGTYGNLVVISHPSGLYTYYGHCSEIYAHEGDVVMAGDVVAAVGSTGRSTGPHCHFEVRYENAPIDPLQFLPDENNAPMRAVPIASMPVSSAVGEADAQTGTSGIGISVVPSTPATVKPAPIEIPTKTAEPAEEPADADGKAEPALTEEPSPAEEPSPIPTVTGPNIFDLTEGE